MHCELDEGIIRLLKCRLSIPQFYDKVFYFILDYLQGLTPKYEKHSRKTFDFLQTYFVLSFTIFLMIQSLKFSDKLKIAIFDYRINPI